MDLDHFESKYLLFPLVVNNLIDYLLLVPNITLKSLVKRLT